MNFEEEFERTEKEAQSAVRAAARLAAVARGLAKAAAEGDITRIRKASERLLQEAEHARDEATNASAAWSVNPEIEERYLREQYAEELVRSANTAGLNLQERDAKLLAYPLVIRVLPSQRALMMNRKKLSALRPSYVVGRLRTMQNRRPSANPQAFLEALFDAYKLFAQGDLEGTSIPLAEIFKAFTLLPGSDYTREDFERDLLSLDRSGTSITKSGARVAFPASTGTKNVHRTFFSLTPEGETVPFYAVKFTQEQQ